MQFRKFFLPCASGFSRNIIDLFRKNEIDSRENLVPISLRKTHTLAIMML
jgi:hypothetical protein